jgi:hypothetical protein
VWGNTATPNPPLAIFTYSVASSFSGSLAVQISDDAGKQIERIGVDTTPGLHRIGWNLRGANANPGGGRGGRGGGGGAGGGQPQGPAPLQGAPGSSIYAGGGGGRGGGGGSAVEPGQYSVQLVKVDGGTTTPVGKPQTFHVVPLPGPGNRK